MRGERTRGRVQLKAERNLPYGLSELRRIMSALRLSESTRDQVCQLFHSAQIETQQGQQGQRKLQMAPMMIRRGQVNCTLRPPTTRPQ